MMVAMVTADGRCCGCCKKKREAITQKRRRSVAKDDKAMPRLSREHDEERRRRLHWLQCTTAMIAEEKIAFRVCVSAVLCEKSACRVRKYNFENPKLKNAIQTNRVAKMWIIVQKQLEKLFF